MSRDFHFKHENNPKAVLLLHGLTGSPTELIYLGKALYKAGYDVHCPVLPGHSGKLQDVKKTHWRDWYEFSIEQFDQLKGRYSDVYIGGLCLGATLAAAVAEERKDVKGLALMAPLMDIDGWAMPWYRFMLPLTTYTPLKFFYLFPEKGVMGVKNEIVREKMKEAFAQGNDALDSFPLICVLELQRFSRFVIKRLSRLTAPMMMFHSEYDDFASIANAEIIFDSAFSRVKEFVRLKDSYHLIAIDNDRELVAQKIISFFGDLSAQPT